MPESMGKGFAERYFRLHFTGGNNTFHHERKGPFGGLENEGGMNHGK